jgi:hypothetical protein
MNENSGLFLSTPQIYVRQNVIYTVESEYGPDQLLFVRSTDGGASFDTKTVISSNTTANSWSLNGC